jgi:hypothetical protein
MKTTKHNRARISVSASPFAFGFSAAFIGLSVVAAGCGISVEAEIPEVTITQRGLAFDGVPDLGLGDVSVERTFEQEHGKLDLPEGLDPEVKTLGITLHATSGVEDLSFIKLLRLTMSNGAGESIELGSYEQTAATANDKAITVAALNPGTIFDAWNTDKAKFTLQVAGSLPSKSWTLDVTIRFSARAKYEY